MAVVCVAGAVVYVESAYIGGPTVGRAWTAAQPAPGPASSAIQIEMVARQMVDTVM